MNKYYMVVYVKGLECVDVGVCEGSALETISCGDQRRMAEV